MMNKTSKTSFFFTLFLIACSFVWAQPMEVLSVPTQRESQLAKTRRAHKSMQAVSLPFRDDFSYKGSRPDTNLWMDANVYVNQTLAQDPPSIGVATFDGISASGGAYEIGSLRTDTADILTSQPVDLSATSGTTILSFWYQPQGNPLAEAPESTDSLALYFYNPNLQEWFSVWQDRGDDTRPFDYVGIEIPAPFLRNNFQFRFVSYGAQAGAYDMWHIDYVVLDDNRIMNDTILYVDIAFTEPHPSLLTNYTSVPWFHYNGIPAGGFKTSPEFTYIRNIPNGAGSNPDLGVYRIELNDNSGANTLLANDVDGNVNIDATHQDNVITNYNVNLDPYADPNYNPIDEFSFVGYQSWLGQSDSRFPTNDTIYLNQQFRNYYAYDDGSAERGYGVENEPDALTIAKYDVLANATLQGLYLNFIPAGTDAPSNEFKIVVYENNNGIPGNLIYESDSSYTPVFTGQDFLLPYILDTTGIDIGNSVFIGVKQSTGVRLNIGFDINTPNLTTFFFGRENNLFQSFLAGSLMMRPFFNYLPKDLSNIEPVKQNVAFTLYPNPVSSSLYVKIPNQDNADYRYTIFNQQGQEMKAGVLGNSISVNGMANGLYLIKIENVSAEKQEIPTIKKFIKAH